MVKHSPIGASSASRWFECPGSIALIAKAPKQESGKDAQRGTAAHWVLEECLGTEKDPWDYLEVEAPNGVEMNEEDIEAVIEAIAIVEQEMSDGKYILDKEVSFDLSIIYPNLFGTADIVLRSSDMKILKVFDYKHGKQPVEVFMNKQLLYYGLGAIDWTARTENLPIDLYGWGGVFETVEIGVIQPRCNHKDGPFRKMEVAPELLEGFAKTLKTAAEATAKPDAPLSAGDHCKWCPAIPICGQIESRTKELTNVDFDVIERPSEAKLPEPTDMTLEKACKILSFKDMFSDWMKGIEGFVREQMMMGHEDERFKLVQKKTNRKWRDEDKASEFMEQTRTEEDLYEKKFVTPAKAEKLLGRYKKEIEHLWYKPEGDLTVVSVHDKRSAVQVGPGTDFERIES